MLYPFQTNMLPNIGSTRSMTLKLFYLSLCIIYLHSFINALPVQRKQPSPQRFADEEFDRMTANETFNEVDSNDHHPENGKGNVAEELGIEYNRYLNEVVEALESDPEFRKKLENASEADIRSGKIAQELEYVNHQVRSKLDELKRTELDRLRELAKRQYELSEGVAVADAPRHVDHNNPHSFEINDLHKLIVQVTNDLAEADRKRRELFKEYELQKRYERDQKLALMTDQEKEEFLKKEAEEIRKRKSSIDKADVHHPGSKKQLEEVWQEQDHMGNTEFNPKAFFAMHDLDGNHVWDEEEVKMLFLKELDKMYKEGVPQNDLMERAEEMERMREHVFKEADTNKDRLISWDEFLEMTRRQEFQQDPGWKPIDQEQVYSQAEVEHYERQRQAEVDRMVREGRLPSVPPQYAHYGGHPQQGYHPGQPVPHPNMPQHVPAQHYNPGVNGMQYVPGNMPPVQVSPQHFQAMHQNPNVPQDNFHVDLQQPNHRSAPPVGQQYGQQVQYPNQQGGYQNQNQQHNLNQASQNNQGQVNQNQQTQGNNQNQQQNQGQFQNQQQNQGINNQNPGQYQNSQQNQGANQNQGSNQNNQQNQGQQALNQNQQAHYQSQQNQGINNQNQQQNQGINNQNQQLNQGQYQQNNVGSNQNNNVGEQPQGSNNIPVGQPQGQIVKDSNNIPPVQNNNIGQGQAFVKEIPMHNNQDHLPNTV
uniref:Nucleobindin-2 n=1 Tax=Cacopsylla melanoneura TaxID=428564 RepID=A0A8D8S0G7_9HEMI